MPMLFSRQRLAFHAGEWQLLVEGINHAIPAEQQ